MAADYHYVSTWQLQAPIERVWAAISQLEQLPAWYPAVQQVQILTAGDPDAVGSRVRYLIKGRLPMRLAFEATITRVDPPRELELGLDGREPHGAGAGAPSRGRPGWHRPLGAAAAGGGHHGPLPVGCADHQAVDEPGRTGRPAAVHLEQQGRDAAGRRGLGPPPGGAIGGR